MPEIIRKGDARALGLKRYFTGKPCPHGHVSYRYVCNGKCYECMRIQAQNYRDAHPEYLERVNRRSAEWRKNFPEEWEARKRRRCPAKHRVNVLIRHRRVRRQTPAWADMKAIRKIYERCPSDHTVDHIIPLKGKIVCGLHVEGNLQYLTAKENAAKGNRWPGLEIRHGCPSIFNPQNHLYSEMATER